MRAELEQLHHSRESEEMPVATGKKPQTTDLRRMPKSQFLREFGGSSKVNIEWHKRYGFPWSPADNTVDVVEVVLWYRDKFKRGQQEGHDTAGETRAEAELRKLQLEADRLQLRLERERGDLISRTAVVREVSCILAFMSERLMQLPDKLAPRFPPHLAVQCTDTIRGDIERYLVWMSEQMEAAVDKAVKEAAELPARM